MRLHMPYVYTHPYECEIVNQQLTTQLKPFNFGRCKRLAVESIGRCIEQSALSSIIRY